MISLRAIPKVLFKPWEAFEELKDNVTGEDGVIIFLIIQLVSLLLFGFSASFLGISMMAVPFGFGTVLTLGNVLLFLGIEFFSLAVISYIANRIALKWGGTGYYHETFAFFCYAKSINFVQAIASIIINFWFYSKIIETMRALNKGNVLEPTYLLQLGQMLQILAAIFAIWFIVITANAISTAHNISKIRGFLAVIAANFIWAVVSIILVLTSSKLL